jgi:putative FmdB family regulatory protein
MPIYEYSCNQCEQRQSRLVYSWTLADSLACRGCGGNQLTRLVSGFSFHRSWGDSLNWMPDNAAADLDDNHAGSIDAHLGRMAEGLDGRVTPDFHEHRHEIAHPDH